MEPRGFPPRMYHDPMFQIYAKSTEEVQSYWFASVGYQIWVLMVVRKNDLNVP